MTTIFLNEKDSFLIINIVVSLFLLCTHTFYSLAWFHSVRPWHLHRATAQLPLQRKHHEILTIYNIQQVTMVKLSSYNGENQQAIFAQSETKMTGMTSSNFFQEVNIFKPTL